MLLFSIFKWFWLIFKMILIDFRRYLVLVSDWYLWDRWGCQPNRLRDWSWWPWRWTVWRWRRGCRRTRSAASSPPGPWWSRTRWASYPPTWCMSSISSVKFLFLVISSDLSFFFFDFFSLFLLIIGHFHWLFFIDFKLLD